MASPSLEVVKDWKEKIVQILKENPHISGLESFTSKPQEVTVEPDPRLDQGFINFLIRVRAADGSTVIAKYTPPYIKAYGEAALLPATRATLEMTSLKLYDKHCPNAAPKPLFFSTKHNIILMEELVGYTMLRSELLAGNISTVAVQKAAMHMAAIHRATHKDRISGEEWSKLEQELDEHVPMIAACASTFTSYTYINDPKDDVTEQLKQLADSQVLGDSSLTGLISGIIKDYVHKREAFIHGDTHSRDILVNGDDAKLIDLELAHLGPISVDVGMLLAHFIMAYYYHLLSPEDNEKHRKIAYKIQDCCTIMVNTYIEHMSWETGEKTKHAQALLKDVAAFSGMELFRSVCSGEQKDLGLSQVEMVRAGVRLMKQHQAVDSIDKIMYIALALG